MNMNMLGKDLENERQRKKVPSFLKKIVSFCFFSYLQYITEWGFLKELDTEYRFWSFMEAHPAHNFLPAKAKIEAMDGLMWAWTGKSFFSLPTRAHPLLQLFNSIRASPSTRHRSSNFTWPYMSYPLSSFIYGIHCIEMVR